MKLFLVFPQDECGDRVEDLINKHFGEYHIALENRRSQSWVIAAPNDKTPANIAELLGMSGKNGAPANPGVIIQIRDYFGYDSGSLWQQMDVWANE